MCNGHFDYWGWCMTWTRHTTIGVVLWKIVAYDHPAPETVEVHRL